ncbi:MAG TPA: histidinol-phosphate transaminase [Actinomycetota bacterium]|nr:histidinol-phosphate transaminase [Actinomycetota bacterium]
MEHRELKGPRPGLREEEPYRSPQRPVPIRLNTNECPYPLPPGFAKDLQETVARLSLNRYPDWEAVELRGRLAERTGWPVEGLIVGNGSNEVIQQLLLAYGGPGRRAVTFEPTYPVYSRVAWSTHTDVVHIPVGPPFVISDAHVEQAAAADPHLIFVCSPNNPTGNAQPVEAVEQLAATGALVVVDEAYIEFGGKTAAVDPGVENVAVLRTFSKAFALAGARLGYGLVSPAVASDVQRVRLPYHVSAPTQAAGLAALRHGDEAMEILDAIRRQRDRIFEELSAIEGLEVFPSDANFVLFRGSFSPGRVWEAMLDYGVLVRDLSMVVPGCLRVTAGTPEETTAFLDGLRAVLADPASGHEHPAESSESW